MVATADQAPVIAPLWKRGMASLIECLPFFILAVTLPRRAAKGRRQRLGLGLAMALSGTYHISLTATRGQTLGQMVLGIRVVDSETAAVPTLKQSAVRWAVAVVPEGLARLVPVSAEVQTTLAAIEHLQPERDRLKMHDRGNRKRLNEELRRLFEEAGVNPIEAFVPIVLRALPGVAFNCAVYFPALRAPRHQGLHDRLAGTVVVEVDGANACGA